MKMLERLVVVLGIVLLPMSAFALQPLSTDDAATMGMAKFQLEVSSEFNWEKANGIRTNQQQLGLTLTAGLLDSLDLVVGVPFRWQQVKDDLLTYRDNGGITDMSLALKWRMLELGPVALAIKPTVTIPTGDLDKGLGAARMAYGATLISTVDLKPLSIHANVGYTKQLRTEAARINSREDLVNLSVAGVFEATKKLQLMAELGTASYTDYSNKNWASFMTAGVSYAVIDNLAVSLGARWGLTKAANDIAALAGLTFTFP